MPETLKKRMKANTDRKNDTEEDNTRPRKKTRRDEKSRENTKEKKIKPVDAKDKHRSNEAVQAEDHAQKTDASACGSMKTKGKGRAGQPDRSDSPQLPSIPPDPPSDPRLGRGVYRPGSAIDPDDVPRLTGNDLTEAVDGTGKWADGVFPPLLERCAENDLEALKLLKEYCKGNNGLVYANMMIKRRADALREAANVKLKERGKRVLKCWLFETWLDAYRSLVEQIGELLNTTEPGKEKRISGLGRIVYTMAWALAEQYYCDVALCHVRDPTRLEELCEIEPFDAKRHFLDEWNTRQLAVGILDDLDRALALGITRYRKESRGVPRPLEKKEAQLARLAFETGEITGFGGEEKGYELYERSAEAIEKWLEGVPIPRDDEKVYVPASWADDDGGRYF